MKQTERELWRLFTSIDRNHDGRLDKGELQAAFLRAGLVVPNSKLNQFFAEVDSNRDGVISFDEWRYVRIHRLSLLPGRTLTLAHSDFLLFIPAETPSLKAVLSYYSSTVQMNPEGDVAVNDELMNGLGTWLLHLFFGSLIGIAKSPTASLPPLERESETSALMPPATQPPATVQQPLLPPEVGLVEASTAAPETADTFWQTHVEPVLTACVPNPGYFVAGGLAGIVSRTTTAPLDRLKVYLIAQTHTTETAVQAAKKGAPLAAVKRGVMSLVKATKELWAAGGMRSLYAGAMSETPRKPVC